METNESNLPLQLSETFKESILIKQRVLEKNIPVLESIARLLIKTLKQGNKIFLFGNGGSAADSQHIAAELVSRFKRERRALPAIALTTDTSILTAIGNDYTFDNVFARQIEALGQSGDVAFAISTSGNSPNVLKAVQMAKKMAIATVGFTGESGGELKNFVDLCFQVPSPSTPRTQEAHITAAHALCDILEQELCRQH